MTKDDADSEDDPSSSDPDEDSDTEGTIHLKILILRLLSPLAFNSFNLTLWIY